MLPRFLVLGKPMPSPRVQGNGGTGGGLEGLGVLGQPGLAGMQETQQLLQQEAARLRLPHTTQHGAGGWCCGGLSSTVPWPQVP